MALHAYCSSTNYSLYVYECVHTCVLLVTSASDMCLCLQDKLDDMEEAKHSIQRELKDKQRQLDAEKRCIKTKEAELDRLKEMMRQRDELLKVMTSWSYIYSIYVCLY